MVALLAPARPATSSMFTASRPCSRSSSSAAARIACRVFSLRGRPLGRGALDTPATLPKNETLSLDRRPYVAWAFPQVAHSAVEMLIIQNSQNANVFDFAPLARALSTP